MKNDRSVSFILSFWGRYPGGGLRIIYEYANRLASRGWKVYVIHPARLTPLGSDTPLFRKLRSHAGYCIKLLFGLYKPRTWFKIDSRVRMRWIPVLDEKHVPKANYIIACPVESAFFVNSCDPAKGKKFYFIQGFEDWSISTEEVEKTWKMPLKKIVIAKWLLKIAEKLGEKTFYIQNGVDPSTFHIDRPFKKRPPKSILFLFHSLELKGTKYAIEAILRLKPIHPDITICTFGVEEKPKHLPDFINYVQNPTQEQIKNLYNSAQIFISPSLSEGWGLPATEAMLCGCIVLATDIGGHREFVIDNETGILCSPRSADAIAEKLNWIFSNPETAEKIATAGSKYIRRFDWDSRVDLFEKALLS